ncbi:MAG: hypothetical protein H0X47_10330 [Nitrospirales bacterium]|nr:hypothetical protein [Nitrospirales bacterium]
MDVSDMKEKAKEVGKQVQEKAGEMGEQVREQTAQLAGQAQEKVKSTLEGQKGKRLEELSGIADAVRQTGQTLRDQQNDGIAHYAERAADQIERVVDYMDARDVGELLNDTEMFARRHPEAFLGGAFMLGLLAGRFLKSSRDPQMSGSSFHREEPRPMVSSPSQTI